MNSKQKRQLLQTLTVPGNCITVAISKSTDEFSSVTPNLVDVTLARHSSRDIIDEAELISGLEMV
jgi:hypothetical protein